MVAQFLSRSRIVDEYHEHYWFPCAAAPPYDRPRTFSFAVLFRWTTLAGFFLGWISLVQHVPPLVAGGVVLALPRVWR